MRLPSPMLGVILAMSFIDQSLRPGAPGFEPGPESPDQAMEWILLAQRDEQGRIPRDGLMKARAQMDQLRRSDEQAVRESGQPAPAIAGIARETWTWIGPVNVGGRVRALLVHPTSTSTLIAGGVAGGLWKSTTGGASWRLIDDFMGNLAVSCIVAQPGQPSRVFVGTGEGFFNADSIRGAGIFVSNDTGESWSQLPSTATTDFDFVNRLAFSADGSTLLAATRTGLFRSSDLGGSWSLVLGTSNMLDVKFLAGSSTQVVASGRNRNAYFSTNGGVSWTAATGLNFTNTSTRVELAVSSSTPSMVYASVDESSGQIWRSTNGGQSYAQVSTPAHLSSQGWYDNAIWVDPTDVNHVIAGGVSLFRSTNGGTSFTGLASCHADQHAIVSDPNYNGTSNRRVYFANDGGVCKIEDVGTSGVTSLRNGLGITQFYGAGGNAAAGRIMGGTQDNGTQIYNLTTGTTIWSTQFGSDGGFAAIDPTNGNNLYGEIQNFRIHRSLTGGTPSQYIYGGTGAQSCTKPVPFQITDACNGTANFISPFMLDPNEPNRLLAGGRSLWRSNDVRTANTGTTGPMWAAIKGPTTGNSNISAIAVATGNSDIVWVGHNNGDVYVALNGTADAPNWVKADTILPNRTVTSIAIDPADPRIVYVSFGGFSPDGLWRTTNSGVTWQDVTGTGGSQLPDVPVRWVVQHPNIRGWLYVATDVGVFASEDDGERWHLPHDGPANVAVFQLFWLDQTLVAVTHGRGMFSTVAASQFPAFARRPRSQGILPGHVVVFEISAVGGQPITYQWFRGSSGDTSNPIPGATSTTFTTPPLTATTTYWVRATNQFGSTDSNTVTLALMSWGSLLPPVTNQGGSNSSEIGTTSKTTRASSPATASSMSAPAPGTAAPAGAIGLSGAAPLPGGTGSASFGDARTAPASRPPAASALGTAAPAISSAASYSGTNSPYSASGVEPSVAVNRPPPAVAGWPIAAAPVSEPVVAVSGPEVAVAFGRADAKPASDALTWMPSASRSSARIHRASPARTVAAAVVTDKTAPAEDDDEFRRDASADSHSQRVLAFAVVLTLILPAAVVAVFMRRTRSRIR